MNYTQPAHKHPVIVTPPYHKMKPPPSKDIFIFGVASVGVLLLFLLAVALVLKRIRARSRRQNNSGGTGCQEMRRIRIEEEDDL